MLSIASQFSGADLSGLPILLTTTTLIPSQLRFDDPRLIKNSPDSAILRADKSQMSFLLEMKPQFKKVEVFKGCGSSICDGSHSQLEKVKCPTITNQKKECYVMSAMVPVGESSPIKITSRRLAKFFISPECYAVSMLDFNLRICELFHTLARGVLYPALRWLFHRS